MSALNEVILVKAWCKHYDSRRRRKEESFQEINGLGDNSSATATLVIKLDDPSLDHVTIEAIAIGL